MAPVLPLPVLLLLLCSVPVGGIRGSNPAAVLGQTGKKAVTDSGVRDKGPRLFAATFNAGNILQVEPRGADGFLHPLVAGHEDADVVILGFQEFSDECKNNRKVSEHIARNFLWRSNSKSQLELLTDSVAELGKPTEAAKNAFSSLRGAFKSRYGAVSKHMSLMSSHFGGSNKSFLDHVAQTSPFTQTVEVGSELADSINLRSFVDAYKESRATADEVRFAEVREAVKGLYELVEDLPKSEDLRPDLEALHGWRKTGGMHLASWEEKFPNLRFNQVGADRLRVFKNDMALADNALSRLDRKEEAEGAKPNAPDDELVFLTAKFLPDHKVVTLMGGEKVMCCCREDDAGMAVTCEVVPVLRPKVDRLRSGCGGHKGQSYHSWVTVKSLPRFADLQHAGECVVPRRDLDPDLHEQMLVTGPAFIIEGAGEKRVNGEYELTGWTRGLPEYKKRGDASTTLYWSRSRNSWRLMVDNMIGFWRPTLYAANHSASPSRHGRKGEPPLSGWVVVDGSYPAPKLRLPTVVARDVTPMRNPQAQTASQSMSACPDCRPKAPVQASFDGTLHTIQRMPEDLELAVAKQEVALMEKLRQTLRNLSLDLGHLRSDLKELDQARDSVAGAASSQIEAWIRKTSQQITTLKDTNAARLERLARPYALDLNRGLVEVPTFDQTFTSKAVCRLYDPHYDTSLHIFANPWSPWEVIFPAKGAGDYFNIDNNGNQAKFQCGKAVNVAKFRMRHRKDGKEVSVCAMNTHMSYRYETSSRVTAISQAMEAAERLECDVTVFVGDFNSRLHCEANPAEALASKEYCRRTPPDDACQRPTALDRVPELLQPVGNSTDILATPAIQHRADKEWRLLWRNKVAASGNVITEAQMPLENCQTLCDVTPNCKSIEHCDVSTSGASRCMLKTAELVGPEPSNPAEGCHTYQKVSPFMKLSEAFCGNGVCSLSQAGEARFADELTQILERPKVSCYEGRLKSGGHQLKDVTKNWVVNFGFREAADPDFAFTYKVCTEKEVEDLPSDAWRMRLRGDSAWLCQPKRKGQHAQKHNLAWTDRILIQGSASTTVQAKEYSRRMPMIPTGSDHLPVVAIIDVKKE